MADGPKPPPDKKITLTLGGVKVQPRQKQTVVIRRVTDKKDAKAPSSSETEQGLKILEQARAYDRQKKSQKEEEEEALRQRKQKNDKKPSSSAPTAVPKHPTPFKPLSGVRKKDFEEERDPLKDPKRLRDKKEPQRRQGQKVLISHYDADMEGGRVRSLAAMRRAQQKQRRKMESHLEIERKKVIQEVVIPDVIGVQELANRMAERVSEVIKILMANGVMATANQSVDGDTAQIVTEEMGHKVKRVSDSDILKVLRDDLKDKDLPKIRRGPVVTVMGHVDHGKTTLLDALRQADTVTKEFGGITQHIGAYQVVAEDKRTITFIDTPGHAAFSSMRARGALMTDIIVLVVAGNEGLRPQTIEAIEHAQRHNVPLVVAINKADLPDADPNKVKKELLAQNVILEEFSGDVQCSLISAKKKENLEDLLHKILLQAALLDLEVVVDTYAQGTIIEAEMDKGLGPVMTVLVQKGTLRVGDLFVAGAQVGRVRSLLDSRGQRLKEARPSEPVRVLGSEGVPQAGDDFDVLDNEAAIRSVAQYRRSLDRAKQNVAPHKTAMEKLQEQVDKKAAAVEQKQIAVVIKADTQGSAEALKSSFEALSGAQVHVEVLRATVGSVNDSDITTAEAASAVIFVFNERLLPSARRTARQKQIPIHMHSIIYKALDDMRGLMSDLLAPIFEENWLGEAEIRQIFKASRLGNIAGCMVTKGLVRRSGRVRLWRGDKQIYEGKIQTLRREKEEVHTVRHNIECGIVLDHFGDIEVGDRIECFEMKQVAAVLQS